MIHLLRVLQLGLVFLTVQLTLKYLGVNVYVTFNKVMFIYLVVLSLSQINLNMVWKEKSFFIYDLLIFFVFSLLVSAFSGLPNEIQWIASIYVFSRAIERYVYCSILVAGEFYKGQLFVIILYCMELALIFLLYKSENDEMGLTQARIIYAALIYLIFSIIVFVLYGKIKSKKIPLIHYLRKIISDINVLLYFLLSVVVLNIDRYFAESVGDGVAEFLFSLSIAGAVFSILSIEIDRLKIKIKAGYEVSAIKSVLFIFIFLIGGLIYWFFMSVFPFIRTFFGLGEIEFYNIISIFFIYGAVYGFMYLSTPFLILGGLSKSISVLVFCFFIKLGLYYFFGLIVANYIVGLILFLFIVKSYLIKIYKKTT